MHLLVLKCALFAVFVIFYSGRILFQVVEQHTEEERPECVLQDLEEVTPARGRGRGKAKGKKTKTPAAKEKAVREITNNKYYN